MMDINLFSEGILLVYAGIIGLVILVAKFRGRRPAEHVARS